MSFLLALTLGAGAAHLGFLFPVFEHGRDVDERTLGDQFGQDHKWQIFPVCKINTALLEFGRRQ